MRRDTLDCPFYVIAVSPEGPCKLGYARNPQQRLAQLQIGNHMELLLHSTWGSGYLSGLQIEQRVHAILAETWLRGEWFDISPSDAVAVIATIDDNRQSDQHVALIVNASNRAIM